MIEFENNTPMREVRGYIHQIIQEVIKLQDEVVNLNLMLTDQESRIVELEKEHVAAELKADGERVDEIEDVCVDHERRIETLELLLSRYKQRANRNS